MKNILIGSRALNYWFPEHAIKEDTDWDIISSDPIIGAEWHERSFLNNSSFDKYTTKYPTVDFSEKFGMDIYVANPFALAIIKRSHLWRRSRGGLLVCI